MTNEEIEFAKWLVDQVMGGLFVAAGVYIVYLMIDRASR